MIAFYLKEETYQEMLYYLSGLWSNASIYTNPSWIIFCKLCDLTGALHDRG